MAQKVKVPVALLNLQPVPQLDYEKFNHLNDRGKMTGVWLEHCQACSVPEIAGVFNRADIRYDIVSGHLHDDKAWEEIREWVEPKWQKPYATIVWGYWDIITGGCSTCIPI